MSTTENMQDLGPLVEEREYGPEVPLAVRLERVSAFLVAS